MIQNNIVHLAIMIILSPLIGALVSGLLGPWIKKAGAHTATITGVALAFVGAILLSVPFLLHQHAVVNVTLYEWLKVAGLKFQVGLWIDAMTVIMLLVVTGISLLVHIYSMGYMAKDPGYSRFFCYMSLFTFAMLVLVFANNGLQLFFGWEGVGVVSYLLISFWFDKSAATSGGLKAFLVNRVGDLGFLLGLAACLGLFHSLDYASWFHAVSTPVQNTFHLPLLHQVPAIDVVCLLLFIGAMGKSAQVPLHVWLPESMEGPTPISALIHAATMVTAGVYMVSRLSPLFECSTIALSFIMIIGATGALFLGLIGVVQNDIKRVVAYSTLSQLGYMIAGTGASAYSASIFHLATHACFKALLFLGAGSVIVAMHHEQDMSKMGGLRHHLPITFVTFLLGSLSLTALPPLSGFFSKDSIIAAVNLSTLPGSSYASFCLTIGAFVTALYTFRSLFMTFFGRARHQQKVHESPLSITMPLVILSVPSVLLGLWMMPYIVSSVSHVAMSLAQTHRTMLVTHHLHAESVSLMHMMLEGLLHPPFLCTVAGIISAWYAYVHAPHTPSVLARRGYFVYKILVDKYGFDRFNQWLFVDKVMQLSHSLSAWVDRCLIDKILVHGTAALVEKLGAQLRRSQTGFLYHYTAIMGVGVLVLLAYGVWLSH